MRVHRHISIPERVVLTALLAISTSRSASAVPVTNAFTLFGVDWVSAAVGGIGGGCGFGGSGTIDLVGVNGPVSHAYLYWHGIDNCCPGPDGPDKAGSVDAAAGASRSQECDGIYENATITVNGVPVTGTAIGDATTNCWGSGSSRAYRADITSLVPGNGLYRLEGLNDEFGHDANGASLIVTFDDGNEMNDRDLVFFDGNDSNVPADFPGEDPGWHAVLAGIHYTSGPVRAQLHLGDGQLASPDGLDDNTLTFTAGGPALVVPDEIDRYDGSSVPAAGASRAGDRGQLWDVHTFDLTPLFETSGPYTLHMDGQDPNYDCLGLVLLIIDLDAGSAPTGAKKQSWGQLKAHYR